MRVVRNSYLAQIKKFMHNGLVKRGVVFVGVIPFLLDPRIAMEG